MDCALSPIQQRNLEKAWNTKVLDRTGLILEIFGRRAKTKEGALQVELAHLNYQRSRLVRSWTHLERQRGGFGFMGGPGETQIEADRRLIGDRIARLENEMKKVQATRRLHRAGRQRVPYRVVALVGYTNAGKSTLFNRLTRADVQAADMLFATLDPTLARAAACRMAARRCCRTPSASSPTCRRSWSPPSAPRWKRCWKPTSFSTSATSRMRMRKRRSATSMPCCVNSASIPMRGGPAHHRGLEQDRPLRSRTARELAKHRRPPSAGASVFSGVCRYRRGARCAACPRSRIGSPPSARRSISRSMPPTAPAFQLAASQFRGADQGIARRPLCDDGAGRRDQARYRGQPLRGGAACGMKLIALPSHYGSAGNEWCSWAIFHAPSTFRKPTVRRSWGVPSFSSEAFVPHRSNAVANATVSPAVTSS